jgi:hypothetical protein
VVFGENFKQTFYQQSYQQFSNFSLTFATPLCCAIFSQKASISVSSLEEDVQAEVKKKDPTAEYVYYNKGL